MATTSVAITVEGVLQKVVTYAPILSGKALYTGLSNVYNICLLTDTRDEKILENWLQLENLNKHGMIVYSDEILESRSLPEKRLSQVNILRSKGYAIDFVVEPNPSISARLLSSGLTVLNFLHHSYALPQWRPDYEEKVKPWNEIEKENDELVLLKSKDARLKEEDNKNENILLGF